MRHQKKQSTKKKKSNVSVVFVSAKEKVSAEDVGERDEGSRVAK